MQVNPINTQGIVTELESQRNQALARAAQIAGANAELNAALKAANEKIKELEAELAKLKAEPEAQAA